ncbi:hypothetical protein, partial [Xenorhabdus bovienii]
NKSIDTTKICSYLPDSQGFTRRFCDKSRLIEREPWDYKEYVTVEVYPNDKYDNNVNNHVNIPDGNESNLLEITDNNSSEGNENNISDN